MSDILKVESKLTDIRTDIESTQSQLSYLSKQVAYSSLQLTFYTKAIVTEQDYGFGYKFKSALGSGWQWLQDLFYGLISAWPMLIIISVIVWLIVRWRKRRRLKTI